MMAVLTYLRFCFRALVHGLVAGLIAGSGAVASILTVKKAMPADWEWLVIAATAYLAAHPDQAPWLLPAFQWLGQCLTPPDFTPGPPRV
ncbi:MAG: hypothetical protein WC485_12425 [Opitutaceae bacterium]